MPPRPQIAREELEQELDGLEDGAPEHEEDEVVEGYLPEEAQAVGDDRAETEDHNSRKRKKIKDAEDSEDEELLEPKKIKVQEILKADLITILETTDIDNPTYPAHFDKNNLFKALCKLAIDDFSHRELPEDIKLKALSILNSLTGTIVYSDDEYDDFSGYDFLNQLDEDELRTFVRFLSREVSGSNRALVITVLETIQKMFSNPALEDGVLVETPELTESLFGVIENDNEEVSMAAFRIIPHIVNYEVANLTTQGQLTINPGDRALLITPESIQSLIRVINGGNERLAIAAIELILEMARHPVTVNLVTTPEVIANLVRKIEGTNLGLIVKAIQTIILIAGHKEKTNLVATPEVIGLLLKRAIKTHPAIEIMALEAIGKIANNQDTVRLLATPKVASVLMTNLDSPVDAFKISALKTIAKVSQICPEYYRKTSVAVALTRAKSLKYQRNYLDCMRDLRVMERVVFSRINDENSGATSSHHLVLQPPLIILLTKLYDAVQECKRINPKMDAHIIQDIIYRFAQENLIARAPQDIRQECRELLMPPETIEFMSATAIADDIKPVLLYLCENIHNMLWVSEIAKEHSTACVNQPVAAMTSIAAWTLVCKQTTLREKLEVALDQLRAISLAIEHSSSRVKTIEEGALAEAAAAPVGAGLQVECANLLLKQACTRLQKSEWRGHRGEVYAGEAVLAQAAVRLEPFCKDLMERCIKRDAIDLVCNANNVTKWLMIAFPEELKEFNQNFDKMKEIILKIQELRSDAEEVTVETLIRMGTINSESEATKVRELLLLDPSLLDAELANFTEEMQIAQLMEIAKEITCRGLGITYSDLASPKAALLGTDIPDEAVEVTATSNLSLEGAHEHGK